MDTERTVKNPYLQVVEDHLESGQPDTKRAVDALIGRGRPPGQAKQIVAEVVKSVVAGGARELDPAQYAAALQKMLATES